MRALDGRIEEGKVAERAFNEQRASFEENLRLKNEDLNASRLEVESLESQTEEKVLYLQLQLNASRAKDEQSATEVSSLKKEVGSMRAVIAERDAIVAQKKEMVELLQNKLFEAEEEATAFREKLAETDKNLNATRLLKDEKESLLTALRKVLKVTPIS